MKKQLTAFIEREGGGYVSLCPELDIASQGDTIEEARENLRNSLARGDSDAPARGSVCNPSGGCR
jgi:hypothetical protein